MYDNNTPRGKNSSIITSIISSVVLRFSPRRRQLIQVRAAVGQKGQFTVRLQETQSIILYIQSVYMCLRKKSVAHTYTIHIYALISNRSVGHNIIYKHYIIALVMYVVLPRYAMEMVVVGMEHLLCASFCR